MTADPRKAQMATTDVAPAAPRILLVDDEAECLAAWRRRLVAEGFHIVTASSGQDALAAVRREHLDAILLDAVLPDLSGVAVARAVKSNPTYASIPIIMISASCDERVRQAGLEAGAEEFLNKPVDGLELSRRLHSLVRLKRLADELQARNQELRIRVTERDEHARRSEQLLARTLDALPARIVFLDAERTIVACNESWRRATTAEGQAHGGLGGYYHPSQLGAGPTDAAAIDAGLQLVINEEREHFECEYACTTKTGLSSIMVRIGGFAYGHERHFVIAHEDTTAQRAAETALTASRSLYGTLVQTAPDIIVAISGDGHIHFANRGYYGLQADQVIGTSFFDYVAAEDAPVARAALARALDKGELCSFDARIGASDAPVRWYTHRLCRHDANASTLIVFSTDVTERREAERSLSRTEAELEDSRRKLMQVEKMESIGRLAGGVAHDFNNTLTIIVSFVRMLLDDLAPNDPRRADLAEVLRAADSATKLTRQLLSFSRQRKVERSVIELNQAITSIDKMLRRALGESIELVIVPNDEAIHVLLDPNQLEQLILNLSVNAKDAMPDGGTLTIALDGQGLGKGHGADDVAHITIKDTGCGMSREVRDRVFEPFFTTKGERGTGFGLATCYGIVTQAGGEIWVDSEPGVGTVFSILLPRQSEGTRPKKPSCSALQLSVAHGSTALAVEDQPPILSIICRVLRNLGFSVVEARTAEEALSLVERGKLVPKLLATDVVLPGLTGVELARRLSERCPEMRILFMSGYTGEAPGPVLQTEARNAFLPKPFSAPDLQAAIARLMHEDEGQFPASPTAKMSKS